jgi:hypothetical protein
MNTVNMGSDVVNSRAGSPALSEARIAPAVAAATAFLLFVAVASQTANPLAFLVGMTPIAWVAIEGAWRLFR